MNALQIVAGLIPIRYLASSSNYLEGELHRISRNGKRRIMNLLLVDDDERIVRFVKRSLEAEGYQIDATRDDEEGLEYGRGTYHKKGSCHPKF